MVDTDMAVSELVSQWLDIYSKRWTSEKYKNTVIYRLNYITDEIGHLPVNKVTRSPYSSIFFNNLQS